MMKAITAALAPSQQLHERACGVLHDRWLCRQRNRDHSRDRHDFRTARVFSFGIGSSVNGISSTRWRRRAGVRSSTSR